MKLQIDWASIAAGICAKETLKVRTFATLTFDPQQQAVVVLNGAAIELSGPITRIIYGGKEFPLALGWTLTGT